MATEKRSAISQVNGKFVDNGKNKPMHGQAPNAEAGNINVDPLLSSHEKSKSSDSFRGSQLRVSSQRRAKNSGIEDEDELSPTLPELSPRGELPEPGQKDPTRQSPDDQAEDDFHSLPPSMPYRPEQKSIKTIDELMASSKPDLEG